jgi:acyl-coenzyme A synthetase/AMP-(fatty) acid ligase
MSRDERRRRGLFALLLEGAEAHPDRVYRHGPEGAVSYQRMSEIARLVAGRLRREERVSRRGVLAVCAGAPGPLLHLVWGGLASGTCLAFLPATRDPAEARLSMRAVGAEALATDVPGLAETGCALPLEALADGRPRAGDAPAGPEPAGDGGRPAFLFATSGSTGEPKWVRLTHGRYLAAIEAVTPHEGLPHGDGQVIYLTPPLSHAYGMNRLLACALHGSAVALPAGGSPLGPAGELLSPWLSDVVTDVEGVPDLFAQMARLAPRLDLPNLRHLGLGGGQVDPQVVDRIAAGRPGLCYSVTYGMTEAPPFVSQKLFRPPYACDRRSAGAVSPLYDVRIVDEAGRPAGPGVEGEIQVRGGCLAVPYLGEAGPRDGWFATGDVGCLGADRELRVIRRRSHFLKVRGFRISPERIESVIGCLEGVADCRVSMRDGELVAEVVRGEVGVTEAAVLDYVAARLPAYCVPRRAAFVERVPRTASGKVSRV